MRLFLAIDLPERTKKELDDQLKEIKQQHRDFDWIPRENFHITLHFFGETNRTEKLIERLKKQLFDKKSFYLYSNAAGLFINKKIIIYLAFRKEKRLMEIENAVADKKDFIPHLTFARYRVPSKQQYFVLRKKIERLEINIEFPVKELVLFQTLPNGKYPIYKKIAKFPLL